MSAPKPEQTAEYVAEHWAIDRPWRCGSQVGRTLYVEAEEKNPRDLFGLVDEAEIAAHIVGLHNWWLDLGTEAERLWGQWKDEQINAHSDGAGATSGDQHA